MPLNDLSGTETGITVKPAALAKLVVSGFPTGPIAGTAYNFTVSATDPFGNVITGYSGTVTLTSTDPNASFSPATYTFTPANAGIHSFSAMFETAGLQSINAFDSTNNLSGSETGITVKPAALAKLVVTGFPASTTAGTAGNFTVSATDASGNLITSYLGTVTLTSTDPNASFSPATYTFTAADGGTHTFSATLKTAGVQSIKASDTGNSSITGSLPGIVVQAAAARTLAVTGFPTTDTAGGTAQVTVTAYDAYGNVAAGYTGTVAVSSSDGHALLPADYTFTAGDAGQHTFAVTLKTAGTQSITVSDTLTPSLTDSEIGISVLPAAAKTLTVTGFPATETAGVSDQVTVTAYDAYGNVAAGYTGTVGLSSSDSHAGLPADYTFTALDAGTHTFTVATGNCRPAVDHGAGCRHAEHHRHRVRHHRRRSRSAFAGDHRVPDLRHGRSVPHGQGYRL